MSFHTLFFYDVSGHTLVACNLIFYCYKLEYFTVLKIAYFRHKIIDLNLFFLLDVFTSDLTENHAMFDFVRTNYTNQMYGQLFSNSIEYKQFANG